MADRSNTREELLEAAQELILRYGFGETSVERISRHAGVTKGSFFHHFDSKSDLAHALIRRYSEAELAFLEETMEEARSRTDDPKQQLLTFVDLVIEAFGPENEPPEGCLFASYCYEHDLFDEKTLSVIRSTFGAWRDELSDLFDRIIESHPPDREVDPDSLADALMTVFEGGYVVSRTYERPEILPEQLTHLRRYYDLLFPE